MASPATLPFGLKNSKVESILVLLEGEGGRERERGREKGRDGEMNRG